MSKPSPAFAGEEGPTAKPWEVRAFFLVRRAEPSPWRYAPVPLPRKRERAVVGQHPLLPVQSPGFNRSRTAAVIATVAVTITGSGSTLNSGEWCDGTGGPPAFAASIAAFGVPPTSK